MIRCGFSLPLRLFILWRAAPLLLRLPSLCCTFTHRYKTVRYYILSLAIYQEDSGVCSISILVFLHTILPSVHWERSIYLVKTLEAALNPASWTSRPEVFFSFYGPDSSGCRDSDNPPCCTRAHKRMDRIYNLVAKFPANQLKISGFDTLFMRGDVIAALQASSKRQHVKTSQAECSIHTYLADILLYQQEVTGA